MNYGKNNKLKVIETSIRTQPNGAKVKYSTFLCACGGNFTTNQNTKTTVCKKCNLLKMKDRDSTKQIEAMRKANTKKQKKKHNRMQILKTTQNKKGRTYYMVECLCGVEFKTRSDSTSVECKKCSADRKSREYTGRTINQPNKYTNKQVEEEAAKWKTRNEFQDGSNLYHVAARRGTLDQVCKHMGKGKNSDNDAVYIWELVGKTHNKKKLYKIGVTSKRLGKTRIHKNAKAMKQEYSINALVSIDGSARTIERELLKIGEDPGFIGFNGATEIRALTETELNLAKGIILMA